MWHTRVFFNSILLYRPIAFYWLGERRVKINVAVLTIGIRLE